jgi:hypothetical protein
MSRANPRFRRVNPQLPSIGTQNLFLATLMGTCDSMVWMVNLAYMGANTLTALSESNIAATLSAALHPSLLAVMDSSSLWQFTKVSCLNMPARIPFVAAVNAGAGYAGTVGATHIPMEMAAVVSKYTLTKGQHGRGRNYWPCVPTSFVTPASNANSLNATAIAAYQTLANQTDAVGIADGAAEMFLAVYQRPAKGFPATQAQAVENIIIRPVLGTVRRRRPGRGK